MGLIYNRKVSIYRPRVAGAALPGKLPVPGLQPGYGGVNQGPDKNESPLYSNLPARIQYIGVARGTGATLKADAQSKGNWDITIPAGRAPAIGKIRRGDMVVSDVGDRYQVSASVGDTLTLMLRCELEEA